MPVKKAAKAKSRKAPARKAAPVKASATRKAKPHAKPRAPAMAASRKHAERPAAPRNKAARHPGPAGTEATRPAIVRPAAPLIPERPPVRAVPPPSQDGEDGDNENMSLLAGPRNVQPYIPKRGEQYMNKEQLEHFRNILNTWKRDLMVEVDRTVLHMKDEAANFPDPNDRATQESEFSLELRTRDRERKLIRKIDEAIKRIEDGSYGYCLETGEEIGIKRLEARPVATLCVEAQERRERREKQYGDRDDRHR
jgi:RNA polymerase-binding transcription factor